MSRPRFNKVSLLEGYGITPSQNYIDVTDHDPPYNPVMGLDVSPYTPVLDPTWVPPDDSARAEFCSSGAPSDYIYDCGASGLWWEATDNETSLCWFINKNNKQASIGCYLPTPNSGPPCPSHTCSFLKTDYCPVLGQVHATSVTAISHTPGDRTFRCFYDGNQISSSPSASAEYTSRKLGNSDTWGSSLHYNRSGHVRY